MWPIGGFLQRTIDSLPAYLHKYVVEQQGDRYSSRDHAAWRYIMRQSRQFFADHAVPIYLEGLKKTGITFDRIPSIVEMDLKMKTLGWGAVPVCGFIPPAAFLDFQARKILPIAYDMRSVDHIAYTPAPDIVHEAAGHAPIIADRAYSEYLTLYAGMAQKAIFCQEDLDVYEAIRTLSDVKENPDSTAALVQAAEMGLNRASANIRQVSEANKVARMNWWTVEYGLLGSLRDPKIYGAGLLSSVSESQSCLTGKVKKLRLTLDCTEQTYNITEPQPQLYVAEDLAHLTAVLREFEMTLSYVRGGIYGLDQAKQGRTVTTTTLDSGLEISGKLVHFDAKGQTVEFIRYEGPVQLALGGKELPGQSVREHAQGFSSPLGRFASRGDLTPSAFSDVDLAKMGLSPGKRSELKFASGFTVSGMLVEVSRHAGRLTMMKWRDCLVTRGGTVFFEPGWGDFDMAVGERVTSVSGGPADRESYGSHDVGKASTSPARQSPFTADELAAIDGYTEVRRLRDRLQAGASPALKAEARELAKRTAARFKNEWLLRLETIEVAAAAGEPAAPLVDDLTRDNAAAGAEVQWLVRQGAALLTVAD